MTILVQIRTIRAKNTIDVSDTIVEQVVFRQFVGKIIGKLPKEKKRVFLKLKF